MSKNDYKIKQREYLSNIIQKIKNENNYDYSFNNIGLNLKKKKEKKIIRRQNLKLNDSLSKEIQEMTPKNTKSTINYEKILDKFEHPVELNSLSNSNKQIIATIDTSKINKENENKENKENNNNIDNNNNQIDSKKQTIENDDINNIINANNELLLNIKNKISIFIQIMQKYSKIFNNIINNISLSEKIKSEKSEKNILETKAKNELIKTIEQFNKLVSNPKLQDNIFMSNSDDNDFLENKINEIKSEEKNFDINKEDLDNLIEKYESKINILKSENEILKYNKENQLGLHNDLVKKNNELEIQSAIEKYRNSKEFEFLEIGDVKSFKVDTLFDEKTKIIDICCGTGAFLITSLNRIKANIQAENISDEKKKERIEEAQKNSLIGVERDASMYALAYANMRFHGDGKSNLFNCSSLLIDSYAPVDESGKTFIDDRKVPLHEAIKEYGDIDIGMINPPYSLDKKDNASTQEYPIVKQIEELKDKNKKLAKKLKDTKKKNDGKKISSEIEKISSEIEANNTKIADLESEFTKSGLREVAIQKGQDELDFIASMLHYLKKGGIGIAIVPMSCAGNSGSKLRAELLKYHTLLACMTMPTQLFFDSHVGTATCVMVFKAHIPHDSNKASFFARWQDDGFRVIPHNGRKDAGNWNNIRNEWIDQIDGTVPMDDHIWLKRKIKTTDEALAEAYIQTDFSVLNDSSFENTLKKYSLYKYMDKNGMLEG